MLAAESKFRRVKGFRQLQQRYVRVMLNRYAGGYLFGSICCANC
jgi:hypothetical protein